eukprot:16441098-Heterocapsa_arctica.AAC.1
MYERAAKRQQTAASSRDTLPGLAGLDGGTGGGAFAALEQALKALTTGARDDDGQLFQDASSRTRVDFDTYSRQHPGHLLQAALKEMQRFLAARGEADPSTASVQIG